MKNKTIKLTEAQVTKQCNEWLQLHGWKTIRLQSGLVSRPGGGRFRVGEKGLPDYIVIRPLGPGELEGFWLEYKATGEVPTTLQEIWHEQARNSNYLVCVADSLELLMEWVATNYGSPVA